VNGVILAWLTMMYFGALFYMLPRLVGTRGMWSERLGIICAWTWNLMYLLGIIGLLTGHSQGREYAEFIWPFRMMNVVIVRGRMIRAFMKSALDAPKRFLRVGRGQAARRIFPVWWWILTALTFGVVLGAGIALLHSSGKTSAPGISTLPAHPAATWPEGAQRAPAFSLLDAQGVPISLREFRGRSVIVTFIDPACTTLCPLEAQELDRVEAVTPAARRPEIIAVSVNPWADSRANFRRDARKWHLVPQWRWAVGRYGQLAAVWKSYKIGVLAKKQVIRGVTVHEITHTEASFVVDGAGYERALFLFPFVSTDVTNTLAQLAAARS
jgi:cytochrome oxidase Cu insertion factor (SCO1/SenC/PrrC family)